MVHSYTKNPEEITRQADIIISAAGVANLVSGSWIKPGAVVIDVGINPVDVRESLLKSLTDNSCLNKAMGTIRSNCF